jgi:ribosomal protein S18 acetylase RimI-like enzyme
LSGAGIITVRPFELGDLDSAARFCDEARALDPQIEPFSQRLHLIATGARALLEAWRVAQGEDTALYGIAFVAVREAGEKAVCDLYCAVHPSMRRQGLGRALLEGALQTGATLRARVRDDAQAGRAFCAAMGFRESAAQLVLHWRRGHGVFDVEMPALRIRSAEAKDEPTLQRLSRDAWAGAPADFATRADEIAQLFSEEGRVVLLAEAVRKPIGYLSAVQLGRTLGIEEVAVLPDYRRMGIAKALLARALKNEPSAVLSVDESNKPARALYRSLGFTQSSRRLIFELQPASF